MSIVQFHAEDPGKPEFNPPSIFPVQRQEFCHRVILVDLNRWERPLLGFLVANFILQFELELPLVAGSVGRRCSSQGRLLQKRRLCVTETTAT